MRWLDRLDDQGTGRCHGFHLDFEFRDPPPGSEDDFVAEFDVVLRTCHGRPFAILQRWGLAPDGEGSYFAMPPGEFLPDTDGREVFVEHFALFRESEYQAVSAFNRWSEQRGPRIFRPTREAPCRCSGGPCGRHHLVPAGPPRYYLGAREITEAEYRAARAEAERKDAPAGGAP